MAALHGRRSARLCKLVGNLTSGTGLTHTKGHALLQALSLWNELRTCLEPMPIDAIRIRNTAEDFSVVIAAQ
ncbi:hypothetical protein PTKU64_82460 [Paraburkholderia terrae]|uniref:Uncharacterized protein n=1 Tax=Paraburkholderia terrae TaxID=311230 RepID=A0ABM7U9S0_9BURK|nr:hypothetical protein PTKU64_82460 [Paraburkholderia terrae]BDC45822.1 hypothetical protein PTKU15_91190 [Paraburkholderia terrae]